VESTRSKGDMGDIRSSVEHVAVVEHLRYGHQYNELRKYKNW